MRPPTPVFWPLTLLLCLPDFWQPGPLLLFFWAGSVALSAGELPPPSSSPYRWWWELEGKLFQVPHPSDGKAPKCMFYMVSPKSLQGPVQLPTLPPRLATRPLSSAFHSLSPTRVS